MQRNEELITHAISKGNDFPHMHLYFPIQQTIELTPRNVFQSETKHFQKENKTKQINQQLSFALEHYITSVQWQI